jgi:hypothetical protein
MKRRRLEQQVQKSIMDHFAIRATPNSMLWHTPNGGYRSKAESRVMAGLGIKRGLPDLFGLRAGGLIAIELKSPTGRLSKHQRETIAQLTAACCLVRVIDNIDDAVAWLEKLGFLRGEMQ